MQNKVKFLERLNFYLNSSPYPKSPFDYRHYFAVGPVSSVSSTLQLPPDVSAFPLQHVFVQQFELVEPVQLFALLLLFLLFQLRVVQIQPSFQLQQFQPNIRDQQKLLISKSISINFQQGLKTEV